MSYGCDFQLPDCFSCGKLWGNAAIIRTLRTHCKSPRFGAAQMVITWRPSIFDLIEKHWLVEVEETIIYQFWKTVFSFILPFNWVHKWASVQLNSFNWIVVHFWAQLKHVGLHLTSYIIWNLNMHSAIYGCLGSVFSIYCVSSAGYFISLVIICLPWNS